MHAHSLFLISVQLKKRKPKAEAAATEEDAAPEKEVPQGEVTFSGPSRSNKHKRPVKKSRKMIEAEEAQVLHLLSLKNSQCSVHRSSFSAAIPVLPVNMVQCTASSAMLV